MPWQPALPDHYFALSDQDLADAITARRRQLGDDLLILGHHYQQDEVIRHADLTGDSLKLSRLAAEEASRRGTKYIVFCGVHFMAETADILTDDTVAVILPDLAAGCPMADMAHHEDVVEAWESIHAVLGDDGRGRVIPVAYVNSSAAVKAFVGEHEGACCTSTNATEIFEWALAGGTRPAAPKEEIKVLFLPDQHLGRNTASRFGLMTEADEAAGRGRSETAVWDPQRAGGGLDPRQIRDARILLWSGYCNVHMRFQAEHVDEVKALYANDGGITVIVHPECRKEVVDKADDVGSTEHIINRIERAGPGTNWAVGTEIHLVNRLAERAASRDVNVRVLGGPQCLCVMMFRIDPQHLLWALDHLARGEVVNRVQVTPPIKQRARAAVQRMLTTRRARSAGDPRETTAPALS
ncbi:MAG: quinolinate synthase NadA [Planctomycetota bacterium]|jgi:quinolinate synthase